MPKIVWDQLGERVYETGVDHGVLYVSASGPTGGYDAGVAWNGLTAVTESPSGAEASPQYADNIKYVNLMSEEEFGATIEAFTYPVEFEACDGTATIGKGVTIGQQNRRSFGLSYRNLVGNDTQGTDYGYKIHLIYGAMAAPSEKSRSTVNDSPEAMTFSWEVTTTRVAVDGFRPTAHLVIDSTQTEPAALAALENLLYGSETGTAELPTPDEVIALVGSAG